MIWVVIICRARFEKLCITVGNKVVEYVCCSKKNFQKYWGYFFSRGKRTKFIFAPTPRFLSAEKITHCSIFPLLILYMYTKRVAFWRFLETDALMLKKKAICQFHAKYHASPGNLKVPFIFPLPYFKISFQLWESDALILKRAIFQFYARYHTSPGNIKYHSFFPLAINLAVIQNLTCSFCICVQNPSLNP